MSFSRTWDFRTYAAYVADGAGTPKSLEIRLAQAEHDARMGQALKDYLARGPMPMLVGIMGGHGLPRSTTGAYASIAGLARHLAGQGYLIVTGGGPGAMEAAHLGAMFCNAPAKRLDDMLTRLSAVPDLPKLDGIITADGGIASGRERDFEKARLWLNAALEVHDEAPPDRAPSLAIPTWFFGTEPTSPLAGVYAKFYQDSIREETLISQSSAGIVYARGAGGTVREIFENAEQNYYAPTAADFTPMIFFDPDGYWERDGGECRPGLNVRGVIENLFSGRTDASEVLRKVHFTVDLAEIDQVLGAHAPLAQYFLSCSLAPG